MKKEYKQIYDNITPDEKTVDAVLDKVGEKKKTAAYKRVCAAALALTLMCGTAGGYYAFNQKDDSDMITIKSAVSDAGDKLKDIGKGGIMIAYAQSEKPISIEELEVKQLPIYSNLTLIDLTAPQEEIDAKKKYFDNLKKEIENRADEIGNEGKSIGTRTGSCHTSDEKSVLYHIEAGEFILDIDDYSQVEKLTVSNKSEYGQMVVVYADSNNSDGIANFLHAKENVLTGKQITDSIASKNFERGIGEYERNDGYEITWRHSYELCEEIEKNHSFDISSIQDEAVFEVLYKNGDVSRATVKISFDEKGNMQLENGGYNYYTK